MNPRRDPIIRTKRLTLRLLRESDADDLVAGLGDAAVSQMLARVPHPYRRSDAEAFVALSRRRAHAGHYLNLAIVHDSSVVGGIGINAMPITCEIGYWLARPWWGRGFATEAAEAILTYGFEVLGLKLIRSGVYIDNRASLRVQQKLGFTVVGRSMRRSLARGKAVPHIDTVLTRTRFQAFRR